MSNLRAAFKQTNSFIMSNGQIEGWKLIFIQLMSFAIWNGKCMKKDELVLEKLFEIIIQVLRKGLTKTFRSAKRWFQNISKFSR